MARSIVTHCLIAIILSWYSPCLRAEQPVVSLDDVACMLSKKIENNESLAPDEINELFRVIIRSDEFDSSKAQMLEAMRNSIKMNKAELVSKYWGHLQKIENCLEYFERRYKSQRQFCKGVLPLSIIFISLFVLCTKQIIDTVQAKEYKKLIEGHNKKLGGIIEKSKELYKEILIENQQRGSSTDIQELPEAKYKEFPSFGERMQSAATLFFVDSFLMFMVVSSAYLFYTLYHYGYTELDGLFFSPWYIKILLDPKIFTPEEIEAIKKVHYPVKKFFKHYPDLKIEKKTAYCL